MKAPFLSYSRHHHGPPSPQIPALDCRNVSIQYPASQRAAISNVNLTVPTGTRVALVGANGAGKSTLLKGAAGLLPLKTGSIRVHGSPAGGCCHRVAYLAQRGDLDWRFPIDVRRLVLTGRYVHLGWLRRPGKRDHEIVEQVMNQLQIGELADRRISELSGGQQQRALLARAMAQEASMLLLDEPLNAVDAETRAVVRGVLRSLSEAGNTIVVATHDPHDINVEFENVVRLSGGYCDSAAGDHLDGNDRVGTALAAEPSMGGAA